MIVTSTGARASALPASMPPKPAPTITTRGRGSAIGCHRSPHGASGSRLRRARGQAPRNAEPAYPGLRFRSSRKALRRTWTRQSSRGERRRVAPSGLQAGPTSLRLFEACAGRRPLADDENDRVLVLGAVPVHLFAEMGHECAGAHRHRLVRVEFVARTDPPGALQDRDETVVGVEMRTAEIVSLEPLVDHDVEARLLGIADQHGAAVA